MSLYVVDAQAVEAEYRAAAQYVGVRPELKEGEPRSALK
jgi:hypothetical protein